MAGLARGDVLVVWEDDDIYLPWHITAHVEALADGGFSKPSRVLSLYTCELREKESAGRFHARIAFRREVFDSAGGRPLTKRGDFDQAFLQRLAGVTITVDTCRTFPPCYVFRWGSTQSYHGQGLMQGPSDVEWYERFLTLRPLMRWTRLCRCLMRKRFAFLTWHHIMEWRLSNDIIEPEYQWGFRSGF